MDKRYSSIPFLAAISEDRIRSTPASTQHIADLFERALVYSEISYKPDPLIDNKLVNEIKKSIPKGIVLFVSDVDDVHNPLDKYIEIYTYIKLENVFKKAEGIAKFIVVCRISAVNSSLTIKTVKKISLEQ